jgi:signal transduction histidine kinase/CheY-like chemotaxis protein
LPQAVASLLCLIAAGFIWPLRRESVSATWLLWVLIGAIFWSFTGALEFSAATLGGKIFWSQLSYIGIVFGPVALFHFAYAHTHGGKAPPRFATISVVAIGAIILGSALTNSLHGWLWPDVIAVHRDGLFFARYERGPMFWVTVVYCYGFMLASSVILSAHTFSMGSIFRRQAWIIILATISPWIANILYVLRIGPRPELDHTPVGFAITGLLLSWAVVRMRLFELFPVAADTLFMHMPDPVLVTDPVGRLVRANRAAFRRFGLVDRQIGMTLSASLSHHPELAAVLESGVDTGPRTFSNGESWWTIESSSLGSTDGRPHGHLIILRDITEQKHAEIDLLKAKRDLEHTLARADTLAKDAMAASTAKSNFLAQVSHDLRTPLHAIIGMTEVLRTSHLDPAQQTEVTTISDAGDTLLRLINDLLDLSRIEAGRIDLAHEPFQLDDVLDQIADLLGTTAQRKGLSFVHWIEPGLPLGLRGDADRLRQSLFNLVGNAVKFTEQGGVTVRASRSGGLLRIEVSDTGQGIAPEHLAGLFIPFNRGDTEAARRTEGTGLGLAITRRLAEAMGGSVNTSSRPGEGTTFTLDLPVISDESAAQSLLRLSAQISGRRIAVAMDTPLRMNAVIQGLQSLGASAFPFESGKTRPADTDGLVVEASALASSPAAEWIAAQHIVVSVSAPGERSTGSAIPLRRRKIAAALLSSSSPSSTPFAPTPGPRRRVLLADDNALSRRVSIAQLAQCNCDVEAVDGGLPALERLSKETYNIIVLDGQMPDLNGWEVAFRLRQQPKDSPNSHTPIVALTADLTPDSHMRWLHAGADVVLGKPVRTRELSETLERFAAKNPGSST